MYYKIPKNIEEALSLLNQRNVDDVNEWRRKDEKEAVVFAHFGLGMNLRSEWNLWLPEASDYGKYFQEMGIFNPDDMTMITLTAWHRQLNDKEIKFEELINEYKIEEV